MSTKDASIRGVKRRTVLRGLATGFAGAVAAPHASSLASGATASSPAGVPPADDPASLRVLSEHDHEVLVSLCELLVPGAVAAGVPELMDRVAAVDTTEAQLELLAAVRGFEGQARATHAAPWVALDDDDRVAILTAAAAGSPPELHEHFLHLRELVAQAYFATEPGMRKLGWTPRTAWRELPRCEHPGDDHR